MQNTNCKCRESWDQCNIHLFKNSTSCGSKFVDSDRGRRVEISTQHVYYVGRKEWIGIHNNQHKANLKEGLRHSKLQINKILPVRTTSHSYPIDWKHTLADQYCHNVINIARI